MNGYRWPSYLFIQQNNSELFTTKQNVFLYFFVIFFKVINFSPIESNSEFTKIPHAFLVRVIQEKIALLDSPVDLEAQTQACILHQVRQDVLS